jgi:hypothetical protein
LESAAVVVARREKNASALSSSVRLRAISDARSCLRVDSVRFAVDADAYDRYMGRYSARLAPSFADLHESRQAKG